MTFPDPNPFERATFNLTRAVRLARAEPEKAKAQFRADLFPPPPVDSYAWVDELTA